MGGKIGMLEHVQIVDDCHPPQIEEVLALLLRAGLIAGELA